MSGARVDRIQALLQERGAEAVLLTHLPHIRWAVGFTGSNALLLIGRAEAHFLSDRRYETQAREQVRGAYVHTPGYQLVEYLLEAGLLAPYRQVLLQSEHLTVAQLEELRAKLPQVEWVPVSGLLDREKAVKDAEELEAIRQAVAITDRVFSEILEFVRPGVTERELAAEITYRQLRYGADTTSFEPIVASGPRSALPHARASDRILRPGDVVVLDFGCVYGGYCSDMTRTVSVGRPEDAEFARVYEIVREAQMRALEAARAGMQSRELDAVARRIIESQGYGSYFGHGLGHGVGLEIHEYPKVSFLADYELPAGSVVTIEPGIYLPGRFGVRIEDMVVLSADGAEVLTRSPKELLQVG
ncbi:MAG: Xaa-Pro peptidase family protein [Bacteroidetes bacterium]|nr:Xaa-Pro peptidase family protein [Rhodothermia bacterium]MCX7906443.1 Xaa-Pro peptidase family protein [Bacteroidota bacterium]MDW8284855.1 Xaa-Pro peptidase family protein [Bacteroidota bacterium]